MIFSLFSEHTCNPPPAADSNFGISITPKADGSTDYKYQEKVKYTCDNGWKIIGTTADTFAELECNKDRGYDPSAAPKCES